MIAGVPASSMRLKNEKLNLRIGLKRNPALSGWNLNLSVNHSLSLMTGSL